MSQTSQQYDRVILHCKELFQKKNHDYGSAWRILRPSSLTDQIFIKANRIRTIQETGNSQVGEGIEDEFVGIINYCVMALIQLSEPPSESSTHESTDWLMDQYGRWVLNTKSLMEAKNHDYGEAWRDMRISSLTDLILMKILRVKQIEDHQGKTLISEGLEANFQDMLNYSVFALILMEEGKK
jgi:hypothetical protein